MTSPPGGLDLLDLDEYDISRIDPGEIVRERPVEDAPPATQMEEELGVQDLGVPGHGVEGSVNQAYVRAARPKLDADRLLQPDRGYPALLRNLRHVKYRGPGHERKYLQKYVMTYQIWANRMWPKANFDDFVVLARRAGRDPRIRQYCRRLIDDEKYPDRSAERTDQAQENPATEEAQGTNLPADATHYMETPPEDGPTEANGLRNQGDNEPTNDIGNDDEWAAAMELYGDLDF